MRPLLHNGIFELSGGENYGVNPEDEEDKSIHQEDQSLEGKHCHQISLVYRLLLGLHKVHLTIEYYHLENDQDADQDDPKHKESCELFVAALFVAQGANEVSKWAEQEVGDQHGDGLVLTQISVGHSSIFLLIINV